ncbi:glycosyltransferase family 4 protein [Flavobacterium helocola]|uniref:Glycosyltransferase family 4 protein n=1 Tax=Flavobacterium helocola TaxID=3139139 RepID=A0ABU9I6W8_9FLAO
MKNLKSIIKKGINTIYALFNYAFFLRKDVRKIKNCECLFFFPYYHTGGAERVHVNILKAIENKNCVVIFTMGSATKSFYDAFKNTAEIIELNPILNKRNKWINAHLQKSIIDAINQSNSIENVFGCNTSYYYQILSRLSKKIKKIDLFHAFEENDSRILDVVNSANTIHKRIVISLKAKSDIVEFYKLHQVNPQLINNIEVIQNGIELTEATYSSKNESAIKIGFVGRWSAEKRPELFLEIAKRINTQVSNIEFVMAGTGMKSNIDLIKNAKVSFLGEITDKEKMIELYKSLHFVLVTSVYEGFPMVMMEAMAYGVIPISTNVGGIKEHITNNTNGLLIDETNEEEIINLFCEQILNLLKDPTVKDRISKSAFNYASEHFGIDKFNQSYKNIFS